MPAPAPTELLNQDISRLASAIDSLAARFDENTKYQRDFSLQTTQQLGEINTKIGSVTTTLRIGGTIVTLIAGAALTLGLTSYQTIWAAGKREGVLETKIDILIKTRFDDYIKKPNQSPDDRSPAPPGDTEYFHAPSKSKIGPPVAPSAGDHPAEIKKIIPEVHPKGF